ncbi:biotin transporter BioY [Candidatus Desantisbacteria bacterium]|nr:biotin transporter BioY [Candidatus Desantisbacteria bacterium]
MKLTVKEMTYVSIFSALTAIGAFMRFNIFTVPFTMQLFFVMLAASLLGSKLGSLSQVIYIILGLIGFPIFAKGGGPQYILEYTFGYLIGFALGAFITGKMIEKKIFNLPAYALHFVSMFTGLLVVYFSGVPYLWLIFNYVLNKKMAFVAAVKAGMLIFLPSDLFFISIASFISIKIKNTLGKEFVTNG